MDTICLLACALMIGQAERPDWQLTPQLAPGLELAYTGSYREESLIPNVSFQREYRLESQVLVMDARPGQWDLAIMTSLSLEPVLGSIEKLADRPTSVRLELTRLDASGKMLSLNEQAIRSPITGPPTLELGFVVDVPKGKVKRGDQWEISRPGQTPISWQLLGQEAYNGITCLKLVSQQESDDWAHPRADKTAWKQRETVWLSPVHLVAQKVERVIERRDPARQQATHKATIRYELESRLRYPGKLFDDRKSEIAKIKQWQDEAQPWLKLPASNHVQIEAQLTRIKTYLEQQVPTPYRKAILNHKVHLEQASKGDVPVEVTQEEPLVKAHTIAIGQRVPDFVVSSLTDTSTIRLKSCLGQPVLVLFYNPATPMGRDIVLFAKGVAENTKNKVPILAMAVTMDADVVRKQHRELRLPFPVLDGQGMKLTFGVESTPRVVLLDAEGVVRVAQTGWSYQTGVELREVLRRCQKD